MRKQYTVSNLSRYCIEVVFLIFTQLSCTVIRVCGKILPSVSCKLHVVELDERVDCLSERAVVIQLCLQLYGGMEGLGAF